jgi:rhamnogalacturonyl hydrolase YesR
VTRARVLAAGIALALASSHACARQAERAVDPEPAPRSPFAPHAIAADAATAVPAVLQAVAAMTRVNDRFLVRWPDPGADLPGEPPSPSHVWHRAVYFQGLMALHGVSPEPRYLAYAERWAGSHGWGLRGGPETRHADDQCAGETYVELHVLRPGDGKLGDTLASLDAMVASSTADDWTWVDALHMSMALFARVGVLRRDARYLEKMHDLYTHARDVEGGGLFSRTDGLWWRDARFVPPYASPNGRGCFWSRGNGWAYAALARVLDVLPAGAPHRGEYAADFVAMSMALRDVRRADGFWNVSLHDPGEFGGPELSGTALFAYGMATGVRRGVLPADPYAAIARATWRAIVDRAVHPSGALGYVQGTAAKPSDRMPVGYDSVPNTDDFAVGAFLLAGAAIARREAGGP